MSDGSNVRVLAEREGRGAGGDLQSLDVSQGVEQFFRQPSEKYSCSLSPLKLTNGSTAIECGGGLKTTGAGAALGLDDDSTGFEIQSLSMTKYAIAPKTTATVAPSSHCFDRRAAWTGACGSPTARELALAATPGGIEALPDNKPRIRSTKGRPVAPAGRRVHCTR